MLNDYHKKVFEVVAPYLNDEEKDLVERIYKTCEQRAIK